MKKIIIPTDFSVAAKNALSYALEIAPTLNLDADVVHVYSGLLDNKDRFIIRAGLDREASLNADLDYFVNLNEEDGSVVTLPAIKLEKRVIQGLADAELKKLSSNEDTEMIVMGTTGSHGVAGKLFGSVSTDTARNAQCPVLLVPEDVKFKGLKHILFAGNYESVHPDTVEKTMKFAAKFGATVHFIHIKTEGDVESFGTIESQIVDSIFEKENPKIAFEISEITANSVEEGLDNYIKNNNVDLLVMVAPKRNFFQSIFHNSKTKKMAFNTEIPLMVLH